METGPEGCLELMADDVKYVLVGLMELNGIEEARAAFSASAGKMFKKFRWVRLDIYSTNDPDVATARASNMVELWNGETYSNEYMFWTRIADGKIVEQNEFLDQNRATAAMKLME